jgi:hypothetical protein
MTLVSPELLTVTISIINIDEIIFNGPKNINFINAYREYYIIILLVSAGIV